MHRSFQIIVPSEATDKLCRELIKQDCVINLTVSRGASLKPVGDVLTINVLNRGTDDVLNNVRHYTNEYSIVVATSELTSLISPPEEDKILNDVDEAIWEEMASGLRHQGRVAPNYVALMFLGGAIATVALVSEPVPQVIAFISASIIAPGFEPVTKLPLSIVLKSWDGIKRGLYSFTIGYSVLIFASFVVTYILILTDSINASELASNPEVQSIAHPTLKDVMVSTAGAFSGAIMVAAYRRSVIAGPLIALIFIPAAALIGAGLAVGRNDLSFAGLQRFAIDVLLTFVAGLITFYVKQKFVHKREPLI